MVLRQIQKISIVEAREVINTIPHTFDTFYSQPELEAFFEGIAEIKIEVIESECAKLYKKQEAEYKVAKEWYNNLPEQDKKMVDILLWASVPCG